MKSPIGDSDFDLQYNGAKMVQLSRRLLNIFLIANIFLLTSCSNKQEAVPTTPTNTPNTETPTLVSPDSLVSDIGPKCEGAFSDTKPHPEISVPINEESVYIVLSSASYPGWDKYIDQIDFLYATTAEDVELVVCAQEVEEKVSTYTDGQPGYMLNWDVRLINWPDGTILASNNFYGSPPPGAKTGSGPARGEPPTVDLRNWIFTAVEDSTLLYGQHAIISLTFSPDGSTLFSIAQDTIIHLWDIKTGKSVATIEHTETARSMTFSPDGTAFAIATNDGITMMEWDNLVPSILYQVNCSPKEKFGKSCDSVAFSPDGKMLAGGSKENVSIWDFSSGTKRFDLEGVIGNVNYLNFTASNTILVGSNLQVAEWDITSGKLIRTFAEGIEQNLITGTSVSLDNKFLALEHQGFIVLIDLLSGEKISEIETPKDVFGSILHLAFSPNGKMLASGGRNVRIWAIPSFELLQIYAKSAGELSFSPDGKWLASGGRSGIIKLWKIAMQP